MQQLDRIQHLRAIAALMVLLDHLAAVSKPFEGCALISKFSELFDGSFGVDIFFVISGFIMVFTCQNKFGCAVAWKNFIWRRISRIVPLYWVLTLAETVVLYISRIDEPARQITGSQFVQSLLFIPYEWHDEKFRPLLGPGWSLNYEMLFYALFALALFLPRLRAMLTLTAIFVGFALIGLIDPPGAVLMAWTRPIILEFLAGAWIGHIFIVLSARNALLSIRFPLAIVFALIAVEGFGPDTNSKGLSDWDWINWVLASGVVAIATLACDKVSANAILRCLTHIGDASYSIYLAHVIVFSLWQIVWINLLPTSGLAVAVYCSMGLMLCIVTGWIIHISFERPVTKWLNTFGVPPRLPEPSLR